MASRAGRLALLVAVTLLAVVACSPGGPSYDELASEPVFTTAMPGATEVGTGGQNPEGNIEGATYGYASRMFASDEDAAAVLAWHQAAYEADGWTRTGFTLIAMTDGHLPEQAWRRGDLIIGFGFPDADLLFERPGVTDAPTLYEVSIAYSPETVVPSR